MKEARRAERRSQPRSSKGPEIAWDQAVDTSNLVISDVVQAGAQPGSSSNDNYDTSSPRPSDDE